MQDPDQFIDGFFYRGMQGSGIHLFLRCKGKEQVQARCFSRECVPEPGFQYTIAFPGLSFDPVPVHRFFEMPGAHPGTEQQSFGHLPVDDAIRKNGKTPALPEKQF